MKKNKMKKKQKHNKIVCFVFGASQTHVHISYLLFHGPQCTRITHSPAPTSPFLPNTHATTYPLLLAHQLHTCHNVPASIHSPTPPAFFEVQASTKKIYALKKKTTVCVRMHWRKRERGGIHTHRSKEYGNGFFFFCFRALQSNLAIFL